MTGGGTCDTPKSGLSLVNWVSTPIRSAARSLSWITGRASEAQKTPVVKSPDLSGEVGTPAEQVVLDGNGEPETTAHAEAVVEKKDDMDGEKREAPDADDPEAARRKEELRNVSTSKAPGGLAQYDTTGVVEKMRQVRKCRVARKSGRKNGVEKGASKGVSTTSKKNTPGKGQAGQGKVEPSEKLEGQATEKNLVEIQVAGSPRNSTAQPTPENPLHENGEVIPDPMDDDAGENQVTPPPKSRKRASSEVIDGERPKKRMLPLFGMSLAKSFKLGGTEPKTTETKGLKYGSVVERLLGASPLWGKPNPGKQSELSPLPDKDSTENAPPPESTTPLTSYRLLASGGDISNEEQVPKKADS